MKTCPARNREGLLSRLAAPSARRRARPGPARRAAARPRPARAARSSDRAAPAPSPPPRGSPLRERLRERLRLLLARGRARAGSMSGLRMRSLTCGQRRHRLLAPRGDADDVIAEGGLHQLRDLPGRQGEGRVLELGHHAAAREAAEVAALGRGALVLRDLLRERREVRARPSPGRAAACASFCASSSGWPSVASGEAFTFTRMWLAQTSSSCELVAVLLVVGVELARP